MVELNKTKTYLKWIGASTIIMSIGSIFTYDIYSRVGFMITQTMLLIYGVILLYIYYYINYFNKQT